MNLPIPLKAGLMVLATGLLGTFATLRFAHAGDWLPTMPYSISGWEMTDTPLDATTLEKLGNPKSSAANYTNAFGDIVQASLVSAGPFENYHDPTVCVTGGGYNLTAKKTFPIEGPGSGNIRAMIFKNGDNRILMYYWQQNRDGNTASEPRMGSYRDMMARFSTGYDAVIQGNQTVLVRILAPINQDDRNGILAQRNVDAIARTIYRSLREQAGAQTKNS